MIKNEIINILLNGLQPGFKLDELKDKGMYSEEKTETEDLTIITRSFKSFDDSLIKTITLYIPKQSKTNVVDELNEQIKAAVAKENYMEAARLQKQKEEYLRG